jgi:hypothetical protein
MVAFGMTGRYLYYGASTGQTPLRLHKWGEFYKVWVICGISSEPRLSIDS